MSSETPRDRPKRMREFLLLQALDELIDDEILGEALRLAKLPGGRANEVDSGRHAALNAYFDGAIDHAAFLAQWRQSGPKRGSGEARAEVAAVPGRKASVREGWTIPALLAVAAGVLWIGYRFWQFEALWEEERLASPGVADGYGSIRVYVGEGFNVAGMAKIAVAEYYASMGRFPDSNAQAGLPAPADMRGHAVDRVEVGPGGIVTIVYNQAVGEDQTIVLQPVAGGGPVYWECKGGTVPIDVRPQDCR